MMENTTDRERDDTSSQAGRRIDIGSEGSLDQFILCVDVGSRRELLTKYREAEHESGVPFTSAVSMWPGVSHESLGTRSIERFMVRCWKRVERTLMMMH